MATEQDYEQWKELRSRVDSIANAVFLIAGGALSLSITVMLDLKGKAALLPKVAETTQEAWWFLLFSMLGMLLNKTLTVLQAYLLHEHTEYHTQVYRRYNLLGWVIGVLGVGSFAWGMILMVRAASLAVLE